jgi:hypothetical protein
VKCAFAAAVMGLGVFYLHSIWLTADSSAGLFRVTIDLAGLIIVGAIIYFAVARILGCRELASIGEMLGPVFGKKKR